jgi:hypothetical protein
MEHQSDLEKVLERLEDERKALLRRSVILDRKRENITRYLELLVVGPAYGNAAKRRAQNMLRPIQKLSIELFVLCALATTQQLLGTVKWTRDEIDAVLVGKSRAATCFVEEHLAHSGKYGTRNADKWFTN